MSDPRPPDPRTQDIADRIVRTAYTASMVPQELEEFHTAVAELLGMADEGVESEREARLRDTIRGVSDHVEHAVSLLDRREPFTLGAEGARRLVLADARPSLIVGTTGEIEIANDAAKALGFEVDGSIAEHADDAESRTRIGTYFRAASTSEPTPTTVALRGCTSRFAISKVISEAGAVKVRMTALSPSYDAAIGARLAEDYGLSVSELRVLEGLVEGRKLKTIADDLGRAVGTVRNQLKSMFTKTGVGAQCDLVSLYGIYARQMSMLTSRSLKGRKADGPLYQTTEIELSDGRRLRVTFAGPRSGRPVLYLNTILTGNEVPEAMMRALSREGLQLVMPWRPGWEDSDPYPDMGGMAPLDYLDAVVRDLVQMLDRLKIGRVPCLAANSGIIFAFALAAAAPERVTSILGVSPILPVRNLRDLANRGRQQRVYLSFARYAPSLVRAYCRFAIAKMDAGFDEEHAENFFKESPRDLATCRTETGREHLRQAMADARAQGVDALALDLVIEAANWLPQAVATVCAVHLLCGVEDVATNAGDLDALVRDNPKISYEWVKSAGNLLLLQHPEQVISGLATFIDDSAHSSAA